MGSILHFFDLNQSNSSKKLAAHKRQFNGNDAPRNSLEFYEETTHNCNIIQDDIPYSCQVKKHSPKMKFRSNDITINRLIDEEIAKSSTNKCKAPSVVARLMGMEDLPSQKQTIDSIKFEEPRKSFTSSRHNAPNSFASTSTLEEVKQSLSGFSTKKEQTQSSKTFTLTKPLPREHPQEEVLQKFKKDFTAWQKSMVWENSRNIEVNDIIHKAKMNQIIAQEDFNEREMARFRESRSYSKHSDSSNSQKSIVILKPDLEMSNEVEKSWLGSPETLGSETNMSDFLEEVKERLKTEILGKSNNNNATYHESGDTKQCAHQVARQIRENVTNDLSTSLLRSESSRSYRSEFQLYGPEFPEFISKETRRLLSERLKNVMQNEYTNFPSGRVTKERVKSRSLHNFSRLVSRTDYREDKRSRKEFKMIKNLKNEKLYDTETTSPRNLVRSFSAPVSKSAFAKAVQEDQRVMSASPEGRRKKKDSFNLKGTVSTLRHNLTFKGKLFGKKAHFHDEYSASSELESLESLPTPPIVSKTGSVQDNSTEVPPSPASVSSSSIDEFCKPGVPSPVSPLQANYIEFQSNAKNHVESPSIRTASDHVEQRETEVMQNEEMFFMDESYGEESHEQAYIRKILVMSGLIEGEVFDNSLLKWDAMKRPIPNRVYTQVEEASTYEFNTCISHKLLFDLINDALPKVIQPSTNSTLKQWLLGPNKLPIRKKLMNDLWLYVQMYLNTDMLYTEDEVVVKDVKGDPWCSNLNEDIYITGKKIESVIFDDLIEEILLEI